MEQNLKKVLKYFSFFAYNPTLDEVYTFFPEKISKKSLKYTPPQYSTMKKILNIKYQISKRKLNNWRYKAYIRLLSFFPQIRLVGLSGSISMMNANEDDDIDLFIITAKNKLFTGRFVALMLAQVIGLRRTRKARYHYRVSSLSQDNHKDKVCLNLFFDESNLKVPKFKQTEFVGHEVLQMKPVINKDQTYDKFLNANEWVFRLFPNSRSLISNQFQISNFKNSKLNKNFKLKIKNLSDWVENQLKKFQLSLINKHKTSEIITNSQLWFHPDDFGKKILTDY